MDVTAQRRFLPVFVGFWAAMIAGCVRDYPADHWLPGVECDHAGICLAQQRDRRSNPFMLAPDCWAPPASKETAGINAERMTLTGAGDEIVFAARLATNSDLTSSTGAGLAVARFDPDPGVDGACPEIDWPDVPSSVANGAHVVGPDGRFWSFAGDVGGTRNEWVYDRASSWTHYEVQSPAPTVDAQGNQPNALAMAVPANGVAIVRSVASGDDGADVLPTALERWTFGPDQTPAWMAQTQLVSGTPAYDAIQSMRGQVRIFPQDDLGNRLVVLGDFGRAVALSVGDSTVTPMVKRPAEANVNKSNLGSTSVLLPLRPGSTYAPGSVLYIGGDTNRGLDPERALRLDLFDPACGTWTQDAGTLPRGRTWATPVLLPDGSIMLAGDWREALDIFYIDTRPGFPVTVGHDTLSRTRGIGIGGLVLADGRVVLAGGREPDGDQRRARPDVEIWEPPYLHAGARPKIVPPSRPILIDGTFSIEMAAASPEITEVVLLAYGSSFMGNNLNQRLVELEIDRDSSDPGSHMIALHRPPARWAPAGRYLLFALTADRIPSPGVPVDVVDSAGGP